MELVDHRLRLVRSARLLLVVLQLLFKVANLLSVRRLDRGNELINLRLRLERGALLMTLSEALFDQADLLSILAVNASKELFDLFLRFQTIPILLQLDNVSL
ncbi:uncharacterized protein BKA78DRAFT_316588 [Phyllosticta capitalensis]|uniref:uncharacterized protein n=1 Tax=Phyllosticta capitalensis TaxID=121624 RepID=UPI00312FB148